jgi:hypothetical protein
MYYITMVFISILLYALASLIIIYSVHYIYNTYSGNDIFDITKYIHTDKNDIKEMNNKIRNDNMKNMENKDSIGDRNKTNTDSVTNNINDYSKNIDANNNVKETDNTKDNTIIELTNFMKSLT